MLHIPLLRKGEPYKSVDVLRTQHYRTKEPFVGLSQANVGLIRRDLLDQEGPRRALAGYTTADLIRICHKAANHFVNDWLPLGEDAQSPQDYIEQLSATTGLPHVLVRRNMLKIRGVLAQMETVLAGLTRNLDLRILDTGYGEFNGQPMSYFPTTDSLGVVLPNNSPGVHSLWAPAFALKTPLVLKPGSSEPWTPYRMIQALIRAGAPKEAFSYYPTDHAGGAEILRRCGRGMVFGDVGSTKIWRNDKRVEVHGPGFSKVIIGPDAIDQWEKYLDVMVTSIVENSGRSCVNASGVWVPSHGAVIAEALAERLARIEPKPANDEEAQLAPFVDPGIASRISAAIDQDLSDPGARDVTQAYRPSPRLLQWRGCSYLLPTIVHCATPSHSLANREYLFPFASVVEVPESELLSSIGPSLVVTAITDDPDLRHRLLSSSDVGRLNFGSIPTNHISWDQPHEGNLFDHLYARRAFQLVHEAVAG